MGQSSARWVSKVELSDRSSRSEVAKTHLFSAAGMTAQHFRISSHSGYDFHWKGRSHYVALHDLQFRDSETFSDTQAVNRRRDLRGSLTFVAAGGGAWGWGIPVAKPQSFTALYLDPRQMETEVAAKFTTLPEASDLYFSDWALRLSLEKLQRALSSATPSDPLYLESLCMTAMLELCMFQRERSAIDSAAGGMTKALEARLTDYVEANLSRDIGLDDLARIAGLSRYHFIRIFKRSTGLTPYRYLVERRVARAERLLREQPLSVAEIAAAVGFKDTTPFIRAFTKIRGVTPGAYRAL